MDISQLGNQNNLQNMQVESNKASAAESMQATKSVSKAVAHENKKAAQESQTQPTQTQQLNDEMKKNEVRELVESMNKNLDPFNTSLKFGFHDNSETYYVSVIDTNTNDIIRKFPSEEAMQLSVKMKELVGMIFDQKG